MRPNQPPGAVSTGGHGVCAGQFAEAQELLGAPARIAPANAEMLWLALRVERRLGDAQCRGELCACSCARIIPNSQGSPRACRGPIRMSESDDQHCGNRCPRRGAGGRARARSNLSVAEVARQLKLSREPDRGAGSGSAYEQLPGPVFVRGFMRNYARLLRLDPEQLLQFGRTQPSGTAGKRGGPAIQAISRFLPRRTRLVALVFSRRAAADRQDSRRTSFTGMSPSSRCRNARPLPRPVEPSRPPVVPPAAPAAVRCADQHRL